MLGLLCRPIINELIVLFIGDNATYYLLLIKWHVKVVNVDKTIHKFMKYIAYRNTLPPVSVAETFRKFPVAGASIVCFLLAMKTIIKQ